MALQSLLETDSSRTIRGTLERVVFHNEDNGYTVFRMRVQSKADPVTVVGSMPNPQPGIGLTVTGNWKNDVRYGRQFQMESFETLLPATVEGIKHYLGSGLIKGIGKRMAARIVDTFGEKTFEVLDKDPDQLGVVKGVSPRLVSEIKAAWGEHQAIRDLIMFLQPHGISTSYAVRIFRHYKGDALNIVRENPYRLAMDIRGIGFVTADAVALKLGFAPDSELRAQAGVLYILNRLTEEGNIFYPQEELIHRTSDALGVETDIVRMALSALALEERVVIEDLESDDGTIFQAVYLGRFHHYESSIAHYLRRILHSPKSVSFPEQETLLEGVLRMLPIALAEEQREAAAAVMRDKVLVVTGGPGTGKTTVINAIIKLFEIRKAKILLAAPTGRAAKRMTETSDREAKTIHRLLEYSPREDGFARNENNPLACGLLVVDEASMLDTMLTYHLLKAVPLGATLVFVGDVNQLPSVGPGNVLKDIIASADEPHHDKLTPAPSVEVAVVEHQQGSLVTDKTSVADPLAVTCPDTRTSVFGRVRVVRLTEVFRQAAESEIIVNAHRINHGEMPNLDSGRDKLSDFYFIRQEDPEKVADMVVDLVMGHIPRRFGLHPVNDIQVLTPMHKGSAGVENLNKRLQAALNRHEKKVQRGERVFFLDDKVMQVRNNYEKDVYNGDIGRICHLDPESREVVVRFDDRNVLYVFEELDEIMTAYAVSVHKSQGSEYPAVILPVIVQHYMLLQRNLIYTGITRGKKLVVLVGSPKALHMAVQNNKMHKRFTWLAKRLASGLM